MQSTGIQPAELHQVAKPCYTKGGGWGKKAKLSIKQNTNTNINDIECTHAARADKATLKEGAACMHTKFIYVIG